MREGRPQQWDFRARIDADGKIHPQGALAVRRRLAKWAERWVYVTVSLEPKRRSLNQNAWYWVAIVPAVTACLNELRAKDGLGPISNDQGHEVMKAAFIGMEETALGTTPISSATLSTVQFSDYCETIRAHAASEWKVKIPGPEEYWDDSL